MKVLLIQPPMLVYKILISPNLGLACIAAVLEKEGFEVEVLDAVAEDLTFDEIIERIRRSRPGLIGSGGQTPVSVNSMEIFRRVKAEVSPYIYTLAGGPHFSFTAEESLKDCDALDIVVRGEGEYSVLETCRRLAQGKGLDGVNGVTFRTPGGEIVCNPDREQIADIDELPFPAWHLFPVEKYHWTNINMLGASSSRGCMSACHHCVTWKIHDGIRRRRPKKIVEELLWVKKHFGVDTFFFQDDASFTCRDQLEGFLDELERCGETFYWYYETREDIFLKFRDLWDRMKKNGLFKMVFGLETPNVKSRAFYGRNGFRRNEIEDMLYYLEHKLDIYVSIYLLTGAPDDDEDTMIETVNYGRFLYPSYCSFVVGTLVIPFPGTEFYKDMKKKGLITTYDWAKYGFGQSVIKLNVPVERARKIYGKFWFRTYARPIVFVKQLRDLFSPNRFRRAMARNFIPTAIQAITYSRLVDYRSTNKHSRRQRILFKLFGKLLEIRGSGSNKANC